MDATRSLGDVVVLVGTYVGDDVDVVVVTSTNVCIRGGPVNFRAVSGGIRAASGRAGGAGS